MTNYRYSYAHYDNCQTLEVYTILLAYKICRYGFNIISIVREFSAHHTCMSSLERRNRLGVGDFTAAIRLLPICPTTTETASWVG